MKFSVVIPTYNGGSLWEECASSIAAQTIKPEIVYVIDSSSSDLTVDIAKSYGFQIKVIPSRLFNHGSTRNLAARDLGNTDVVIFMTQDAVLDSYDAFEKMIEPFCSYSNVAAVCGRQIPHIGANPLAKHARFFNYPEKTEIKSKNDIHDLGIKAAFISNSFSAYRVDVFNKLGGFPENTILSEDMYLAAKMILADYKIIYNSDACVRHSHNYTPLQEFKRYFDIGVFHADNQFIMQSFGSAGGEGVKYVVSEIKYLLKNAPLLIPKSIYTMCMKFLGFKLGLNYKCLPLLLVKSFSMHKGFWSL